jgi:hypothetical protein
MMLMIMMMKIAINKIMMTVVIDDNFSTIVDGMCVCVISEHY